MHDSYNTKVILVPANDLQRILSRALNTLEPHQWPQWAVTLCGAQGALEDPAKYAGDVAIMVPQKG